MRYFVELVEVNDWEGETWSWWLQLDGNEDALRELGVLLSDEEGEEEYQLSDEAVSETDVDLLVRHSKLGYYPSHTKVTGVMTPPVDFEATDLYKGGIRAYYKEAE